MEPLVAGPNVFLRHPRAADEAEFVALRIASRELLAPWEPAGAADPEAVFAGLLAKANTERHQKHLACRVADGRICGYVGLNEIVMGPFRSAYLGYWTGAPFVGRGYATEAVGLCIARAFRDLGLHRVEANIVPGNEASLAVARRCGLRQEGYSPRYLEIAGSFRDHERWALTVEDWRLTPPSPRRGPADPASAG